MGRTMCQAAFVVFVLWAGLLRAAVTTTRPDLSGIWLVDSASSMPPHSLIRSKLTLTDHTFALTGYWGITNSWTGEFTLGANGDAHNLDLHTNAFDMSERGTTQVYPAAVLHGIYKISPSPDGERLTICFAIHEDEPRPTTFIATDYTRTATFVRAEADFKSFPKDVTVTILDPQGQPDPKGVLFEYMSRNHRLITPDNGKTWRIDFNSPLAWQYNDVSKAGSDGTIRLTYDQFENEVAAPAGARDQAHRWTGFANVSPAALRHGTLTIHLQPERMVRGTIACDSLTRLRKPIPHRYAYLFPFGNRIAWCWAENGVFEFPVPPGEYELDMYGNDMKDRTQQITVPAGEGDFVLPPVSLEAPKIMTLIGEPAPPLEGIVGWKGKPVNLASLKGKIVLLNFWGYWCGSCVVEMPTLMRLNDQFKDKGLTVVGVHVDNDGEIDTAAKLDEKTAMYRTGIWKGRDLPFPTALASGRSRETGQCLPAADYGVLGYPTTIVIDRNGKVLGEVGDEQVPFLMQDEKDAEAGIAKLLDGK
jgi:thiol-disulfide isomerase/thioredoxin